jgi:hypothetical protein
MQPHTYRRSTLCLLLLSSWGSPGLAGEADHGFEGHWEGAVMAVPDPLGIDKELAWDVFLLYPLQARWEAKPPRPNYFMCGRDGLKLPADLKFDGLSLAEQVRRLLAPPEGKSK